MTYLALVALLALSVCVIDAQASGNPNLFVSAENPRFENHFSGSMVIEVIVRDPNLRDTGKARGEPDVTINGNSLRMVQATDGNWYAYFANVAGAQSADSTVRLAGQGLDFGVFCSSDTPSSVVGISLSETRGFAIPRHTAGSTDGNASLSECTGLPSGENLNNVIRNPRSINTNPAIPAGQIGLNQDAWPLIQLFSFGNANIRYNLGGSSQQVVLEYDEIPNISLAVDRDIFPNNADVILTVSDIQLNQDPTDEDSWTFGVGSHPFTFYQAYVASGNSANSQGLADLTIHLADIGFEDNGQLSVNLGSVLELQSNDQQRDTSISDGTATFSEILTLVETGRNSGIFDSADNADQSILKILGDAPRGQSGSITYNKKSISVVTGSSSALLTLLNPTLAIGDSRPLRPGTVLPVVLYDPDQNINSGSRDDLDVFRDSSTIPTMRIGSPITLEDARDVNFYPSSALTLGNPASLVSSDPNSARLVIDTSAIPDGSFEKVVLNLGVLAADLKSLFVDVSAPNSDGSNWLNYDLRSFANDLRVSDFADTSLSLSFGTPDSSPVTLAAAGTLGSQGLVQIGDGTVQAISTAQGAVYVIINLDSSNDSTGVGTISGETDSQPIVLDFFSFGVVNSNDVNNSIYRFELEETTDNSSTFDGTLEYSVATKSNILNPSFIQTIQTISDDIRFIATDMSINDGISISYSDLDVSGIFTLSTKSEIGTSSGILSADSASYRFGQPVTITLDDPDLNLKNDIVDIYSTVNDPNSENVDTVGEDGAILLEVLIKNIRYKRCIIDGVEHGGLGASGFSLVETGPSTGIFEGTFKMPSTICNKSGTQLVYSAGGSLDAKYYDSRDDLGDASTFGLLRDTVLYGPAQLSSHEVLKPVSGVREITLSGTIDDHRRGIPLAVDITTPDGNHQSFGATLSGSGNYKSIISINEDSILGVYEIKLSYDGAPVDTVSFKVAAIPDWIKNTAREWSFGTTPDTEFINGVAYLAKEGLITAPGTSGQAVPDWVKNIAKWWANDQISDKDFIQSIQYLVKKSIIRIYN